MFPYQPISANPVKLKIGRFGGSKIGRNSKHFRDIQRHTEDNLFYYIGSTISLNDKIDKKEYYVS